MGRDVAAGGARRQADFRRAGGDWARHHQSAGRRVDDDRSVVRGDAGDGVYGADREIACVLEGEAAALVGHLPRQGAHAVEIDQADRGRGAQAQVGRGKRAEAGGDLRNGARGAFQNDGAGARCQGGACDKIALGRVALVQRGGRDDLGQQLDRATGTAGMRRHGRSGAPAPVYVRPAPGSQVMLPASAPSVPLLTVTSLPLSSAARSAATWLLAPEAVAVKAPLAATIPTVGLVEMVRLNAGTTRSSSASSCGR